MTPIGHDRPLLAILNVAGVKMVPPLPLPSALPDNARQMQGQTQGQAQGQAQPGSSAAVLPLSPQEVKVTFSVGAQLFLQIEERAGLTTASAAGIKLPPKLPLPSLLPGNAGQTQGQPGNSAAGLPLTHQEAEVTFSAGVQLIRQLEENEAAGLHAVQPGKLQISGLFSGESPHPAAIAGKLRDAVEGSGAFYEAHLAQWLQGKRSPQAVHEESARRWPAAEDDHDHSAAVSAAPDTASSRQAALTHDVTLGQQLNFLRGGEMAWRMETWPNADALLRLSEEPESTASSAHGSVSAALELDLPNLGRISVKLRMADDVLDVLVAPEETGSVARRDLTALTVRLGHIHGVRLDNIRLERHGTE